MSWDDSTFLRQEVDVVHSNGGCTWQVGRLEHATTLKRKDDTNANGKKKSRWGMTQSSKMLPGIANNFSSNPNADWVNEDTEQTQNWGRTDLSNLENVNYNPSSSQTTSLDGTLTLSVPPTLGVSADYPKVSRTINYDPDAKVQGLYGYSSTFGTLDAYNDNIVIGEVTGWITDRPSSGDKIAPSFLFGEFEGAGCNDSGNLIATTEGETLFVFFDLVDIDDV